ncbi:MAG: PD-(D/E)XK nuclease family protein [Phycisphaerae bacterium]
MAVQFVIGRAGTGKTQFCVDALVAESRGDPLGPPLFWLMPEQATFMSEQRLLATPEMAGSFRIRVLGFRRLCRFLTAELNLPLGLEISPTGRQLLLARAVLACRDQLTVYRPVAELPGFLACLDQTLREFMQGRQNAEQLRAAAAQLYAQTQRRGTPAEPGESVLADKLHDLALLLESWEQVKPVGSWDGETLPMILENGLADQQHLHGVSIYVDAFSSMSAMEIRLLTLLANKVATMVITLLADPTSPAIVHPGMAPATLGVFHRTEQLYQRLLRHLQASGATIEKTRFLHTFHRGARSPALGHIESQLFSSAPPPSTNVAATGAVELLSCPSPEEEVLCAGRRIRAMAAAGLRYREIGVIVSDLTRYAPLIRPTFTALEIPFFLDQRQSLKFHPLVELLHSVTALVHNGFSRADLQSLIKTSLTGLSDAEACSLENYFLAHGITADTLQSDWTWDQLPADAQADQPSASDQAHLASINAARRQLRAALEPWITRAAAPDRPQPIAAFSASLVQLLENMRTGAVMEQWINKALADGLPELAQIHEQAWAQCRDMLQEMSTLPSNHTMTLSEFSELLRTVLENFTLGLIPPAVDQVLISSAQRSRHPELKAVLVLGALETLMPKATTEDAMLNDADRRRLKTIFGDALHADTADDFMEASFFDYVAFTRASNTLLISYPAADADGRKTAPSIYISRIRGLFSDLTVRSLESTDVQWTDFAALDELIRWVLLTGETAAAGAAENSCPTPARTAAQWLRSNRDLAVRRRWEQAIAAQSRVDIAELPAELGRFGLGSAIVSVSELETFAACALRHFYSYTLHLRERPEWQMDARNLGTVYHQALDLFYHAVISGQLPWPDCQENQLQQTLTDAIKESTRSLAADAIAAATELQAVIQPMRRHLGIILEAQRRAAEINKLRPVATELRFGRFPHTESGTPILPPISLAVRGSTPLELRGKIDRVDMDGAGNVMLIDYKSSAKNFKLGLFVHGLDLQLVAYMLAVRGQIFKGSGPLKPIGAFYYPLRPKIMDAPENADDQPLHPKDAAYFKNCKPDGPFDNDAITILDSKVDSGQSSPWFKIALGKERKPHGSWNGGLDHALFFAMLDYGWEHMRQLAELIRSGTIAPNPYKVRNTTPCTICEFKSICPFDRQRGRYRIIDTGKQNAAAMLRQSQYAETVEEA